MKRWGHRVIHVLDGCSSDSMCAYFTLCMRQDPEWDESSAFFANAASHIRPKGSSRRSKENKENESKREVSGGALILYDESV